MFATFELVSEDPPVYLLTAKCGESMDFEPFAQMYTSMYQKPRFALIVDLRELTLKDAPYRHLKNVLHLLQSLRPKTAVQVRGSAIVVNSPVVKWALNLLMQQYEKCAPMTVVDNAEDAALFVQQLT